MSQNTKFQDHPDVIRFQKAYRLKVTLMPVAVGFLGFMGSIALGAVITRRSTLKYLALYKQHFNIIESSNLLQLKQLDKDVYKMFKAWPKEKVVSPNPDIRHYIEENVKMRNAFSMIGIVLGLFLQTQDLSLYNLRTDIYRLRNSSISKESLEYEEKEYNHPLPEETSLPVMN